ncbi:hypothetical protein CASFOL_024162 [Castilleja foliolosa]|uniref:Uncharacterized protein n=1 Tax=Castilleja foliolosa TaxID=1961234 RepID=A0ABD3CMI3_9LAMI
MPAAKILGCGGTPNTLFQCVTLPNKLYYIPSKLLYSTIIHPQPTKIRAFSVRACGRGELLPARNRLTDAINFSGSRVTIGDVASKDSFKSNQAQKALQALAANTNGRSQTLDDGVFNKSLVLMLFIIKIQSLLEKGKVVANYLMRASFWVSLQASSVVGLTIAVFMAVIFRIIGSPEASIVMDNIQTAFSYLCSVDIIDSIFSYVFGDGDPNQGIEEDRWKMIRLYIALNGSVVTAEEIAPYLDPETTRKMNEESYMLPVLQQFDGQPKVDEKGNILYHFPSVHCTSLPRTSKEKEYAGRWADRGIKVEKFLEEYEWEFSEFVDDQLYFVAALLHYNLFCVVLSGFVLRVTLGWGSYLSQYLFLPLLLLLAVSFLVISSLRCSSIVKRNAEIVKRNEAREECAKSLESPDLYLMQKLLSARIMARNQLMDQPMDNPNDQFSRSKRSRFKSKSRSRRDRSI